MSRRPCSTDGCDRPVRAKGRCESHYKAWRKAKYPPCTVPGCDRLMTSLVQGMCEPHVDRVQRYGDTFPDRPIGDYPRGTEHASWKGNAPGYTGAHARVRRLHGSAKAHACPCGEPAEEWAYDHTDPDEHTATVAYRGVELEATYSPDPTRYRALCKSCHTRFDMWAATHGIATLPPTFFDPVESGKRCARCDEAKPSEGFVTDSRTRDGLQSWCRDCMNEYKRERRAG